MNELGGLVLNLSTEFAGGREPLEVVARNLERWVRALVVRTYAQDRAILMATMGPKMHVINALTDQQHPCLALADALRMLTTGSFDVAILQGLEASKLVHEDPRFKGKVQQAELPYSTVNLYLMVGRGVYQRDPQRIEAIWQAIGSVRQARDYRQIEESAGIKHFH